MEPDGDKFCAQEKTLLFYWTSEGRETVCTCLHIFIASMEEKLIFLYDFFLIIYFGFFPLGSLCIKVSKFESASKLDESNF